VFEYFVE